MGIFRFIFTCITQAVKIAIGVALTIALFFAMSYLIDVFAARKTAPPADPRLKPYADRGMPLTGSPQKDRTEFLDMSFFETLLNKKPDVMPEQPPAAKKTEAGNEKKAERSVRPAKKIRPSAAKKQAQVNPRKTASQRVAEIRAKLAASARRTAAEASGPVTYSLQLGSFQSSEVAVSFTASLAAKGYEAHIVKGTLPNKGIVYRVRFGKYKDLEDAQKAAARLEKKEGISAFITSR